MRRLLLLFAATLVCAAPPAAARPPQLVDARGDYPVPAGDIVSVRFSSRYLAGRPHVLVTMSLNGAVGPYYYTVVAYAGGCRWYASYTFTAQQFNGGCMYADTSPPTAVEVVGDEVRWTVPMTGAMRRGSVVSGLSAQTTPLGVANVIPPPVAWGDVGKGTARYVVGEDLAPQAGEP